MAHAVPGLPPSELLPHCALTTGYFSRFPTDYMLFEDGNASDSQIISNSSLPAWHGLRYLATIC